MLDFVSLLRKVIDEQATQSLEVRHAIYGKVRQLLDAKLIGMGVPIAVAQERCTQLELAIELIELEYAALDDTIEGLEKPPELYTEFDDNAELGNYNYLEDKVIRNDTSVSNAMQSGAAKLALSNHAPNINNSYVAPNPGVAAVADDVLFGNLYSPKKLVVENFSKSGFFLANLNLFIQRRKRTLIISGIAALLVFIVALFYKKIEQSNKMAELSSQLIFKGGIVDKKDTYRRLPNGLEINETSATPGVGKNDNLKISAAEGSGEVATSQLGNNVVRPFAIDSNKSGDDPSLSDAVEAAILYEIGSATAIKTSIPASVRWKFVSDASLDEAKTAVPIVGQFLIDSLGIKGTLSIKKQLLQGDAFYLMDIDFSLPAAIRGGKVVEISQIVARFPQSAAKPLVTSVTKTGINKFRLSLGDTEFTKANNLDLLNKASLLDMVFKFADGKQAVLRLDKGASGELLFAKIIQSWH